MATTHRRCIAITGASSGIGEEFARRFAAQGADLVLVARRKDRLVALAAELTQAHGISVTVLDRDLAMAGAAQSIVDDIDHAGLTIDGLINSAGFGTAGAFADENIERVTAEIQVNVAALTALTRLLMPALLASPAGLLINISSTAAYQPLPNMAVYAATKAYVTALTEAIWQETRGSSLRVLALAPGPTDTEFFDVAGSDVFKVAPAVSARRVVDVAMGLLDTRNSPPSHIVGLNNWATAVAAKLAPRRLALAIASRVTGG
jgi:short-subunit dehydrogenase